jgi:hypothetical protein
MQRLVREVQRRGVNLEELDALEVFARDGSWVTVDYARKVRSLEAWEIDDQFRLDLEKNLPGARIRITDSIEELKRCSRTFGFVVVDNPIATFGSYCEHFDVFPGLFRILDDPAIVVLNVIPETDPKTRQEYPFLFNDVHLGRRRDFYRTDRPESVPIERMVEHYRDLMAAHDRDVDWHFSVRRNASVTFLVLGTRRRPN